MPYSDHRTTRADHHSEQAEFNLGESYKIADKRDRRLDYLRAKAERQYQTRVHIGLDSKAIMDNLCRGDLLLEEYGAGLQITERRAHMHAAMATDLRLQMLTDLLSRPAA